MKNLKRNYIILLRKPLLIMYGILLCIHFIIKDRFYPINIVYYAFPIPILIIAGMFLNVCFFKLKKIFYSLIICLFFLTIYWFSNYYKKQSTAGLSSEKESVLFWNIGRSKEVSLEILIRKIKSQNVSLIALVEADELSETDLKTFRETFPLYSIKKLEGGMIVAVKGIIDAVIYRKIPESFKFNYVSILIANKKKSILIADVNAVPFHSRRSALDTIYEFIIRNNPPIVVGDFNTPFESIYFNKFRTKLHSFRSVSDGFTATWPYGIPLLELDQMWSIQEIKPLLLKKEYYKTSDHALLIGVYE